MFSQTLSKNFDWVTRREQRVTKILKIFFCILYKEYNYEAHSERKRRDFARRKNSSP